MRISDWSSDVCSSDLHLYRPTTSHTLTVDLIRSLRGCNTTPPRSPPWRTYPPHHPSSRRHHLRAPSRSEEHTSELQSLVRISYAVFCLKKKTLLYSQSTNHMSTLRTIILIMR